MTKIQTVDHTAMLLSYFYVNQYDIVGKKLDVHMRMEIVEFDIDIDNGFTNDLWLCKF